MADPWEHGCPAPSAGGTLDEPVTAGPAVRRPRRNAMDYDQLVRKLSVPPGFAVPTRLTHGDIVARALSRADLADDVRGINASIDIIRRTRGGSWPVEKVTEEFNFVDLVWHECEFREGDSFAYAVYDVAGAYLGCCYLYPMGRRTPLSEELAKYDVDVSWWVTPSAYEAGHYSGLYRALRQWLAEDLPFTEPYFSNREIPSD
ncbi:hypothetical protein [Actinomadura madurae]|uniref:hypothetical protein n=2 Tax=Actinomadura madurae TaxID=1993 RepID=UPI0020D25144|nr:hypothetical protein [Actinomadura madurae]MCQ0006162.1 hypothetical protein [Actinomadura madurae]